MTNTKTNLKTKTKTKYRKDYTCDIFSKNRECKYIKNDMVADIPAVFILRFVQAQMVEWGNQLHQSVTFNPGATFNLDVTFNTGIIST